MPSIPTCANHLAGSCERSDTYVSKETDNVFVIACRTCKSINVWPKDKDEKLGKYQAFLKHQAAKEAEARAREQRIAYSLPTGE